MPEPRQEPQPPTTPKPPRAGVRARLRALAIVLALLVQCTSATPDEPLDAAQLARPEGQRALARIEAGLALVGLRPARERLTRETIAWSELGIRLRAAALAPFEPLLGVLELDQRWALFSGTERETFRLHVDGRGEVGAFQPIYRAPGGDDALSQRLQYRRVRGIYHPSLRRGVRAEYTGFTRWLARELFAQRAELAAVRVRMERFAVGEPGAPPRRLRYEHSTLYRRGELP